MRTMSLIISVLITAAVTGCAAQQSEDRTAPAQTSSMTAATPTADALQDCLVRIPKDASPGQRAIAERTCQRDLAERTTTARGETASSGTQGDTLQACLARIPREASAGQRMIAEQSCQRDEANRRAIQGIPGR